MAKSRIKDRRRVDDYWSRKARREQYPARSVFKLEEVDRKYGLLKPGHRVLDLGCHPGSWTLYASGRVGPGGEVVGVDLKPTPGNFAENTRVIQGDVLSMPRDELFAGGRFDVILSDMAPQTSGIRATDQARSVELVRVAFALAREGLRPGGSLYFKIFEGPDAAEIFKGAAEAFAGVRRIKPRSSRSFSSEYFGLAQGFKPRGQ